MYYNLSCASCWMWEITLQIWRSLLSPLAPSSISSFPCMLTVHQQQSAARSPSSFVTAHLCAQQGGDAAATADRARPLTAPALMRCSCFQIQPLILILFFLLNMAPKGTSDPVVFVFSVIVEFIQIVHRRLRNNITKGRELWFLFLSLPFWG